MHSLRHDQAASPLLVHGLSAGRPFRNSLINTRAAEREVFDPPPLRILIDSRTAGVTAMAC